MIKKLCLSAFVAVVAVIIALLTAEADLPLLLKRVPDGFYKDKVVWVVGASSGIGEFFAREVAAHGAKVVLSARRVDRLHEVAASLPEASVVPLDMLDYATHAKAVEQVIAQHGRIDIVVLNAGRGQFSIALDTEFEVTEAVMQLNFLSQVHLAKLIMPHFVKANGGHFVVVSSMAGKMGVPLLSSYAASKHALHGYFDALRAEAFKLHNIAVSIVCPGTVESEIRSHVFSHKVDQTPNFSVLTERRKMSTKRCAELMAVGVAHKVPEMWITIAPPLAMPYMHQLFPRLVRGVFENVIGPNRVQAILATRENATAV